MLIAATHVLNRRLRTKELADEESLTGNAEGGHGRPNRERETQPGLSDCSLFLAAAGRVCINRRHWLEVPPPPRQKNFSLALPPFARTVH